MLPPANVVVFGVAVVVEMVIEVVVVVVVVVVLVLAAVEVVEVVFVDGEVVELQTSRNRIKYFNSFKPNGISHYYQMANGPIHFRFKACWVFFFHFYSNFDRIFFKQTVETLIRRRVLRRMIWVSTVCLCPTKRTID